MSNPIVDWEKDAINHPSPKNNSIKTPDVISLLKAEEYAEKFIKTFSLDQNYDYQLPGAQLWGIEKDSTFSLIDEHPDVYDLLDKQLYDLSNYIGIIVHTTGWAAPLNSDGSIGDSPSQHTQRQRIVLAAAVTHQSAGSALAFANNKEIIIDPGSASGSLAEALQRFWKKNF